VKVQEFRIFYAYARQDQGLRNKLESHQAPLQRQRLIVGWHDRYILGGQEWSIEISEYLNMTQMILLLISDAFPASAYCYGVEMNRAMAKHKEGSAHVIPIILRHADWHGAPFAHLQALPTNGDPVIGGHWRDQDKAFADIVKNIRKIVEELRSQQNYEEIGANLKEPEQIIPDGVWVTPQEYEVVGDSIEFTAFAYTTNPGDPPIQLINLTTGWSGYWQIAQTVYPLSTDTPHLFRCHVRLSDLFKGIPLSLGEIKVSFDVYDQQGNKNLAPNSVRTLIYQPGYVQAAENMKGQNYERFGSPRLFWSGELLQ
jgi:hypothetical protein